jgi:hypothetical protein
MPPKKKPKISPSDGALAAQSAAAQFKEGELTKESLLSYVRCVARDPACITFPAYNYPKHKTMVLKVLMSMYVGPEIGKKKRKLYDNRKRPCSPSLFREASSALNLDTSNNLPGSPSRFSERGRRKEERAGPSRRLEEYLSFVGNTYYSMPKQSNFATESGSSSSTSTNYTSSTSYPNSNSTVLSIGDLFPMKDEEEANNGDLNETEDDEKAVDKDQKKNNKRTLIPGRDEIAGLTLQRQTTLGILKNPARPRQVLDEWAPKQVALFEAAICIYGKNFYAIQKVVETKTLKQVIEFYYLWKKSSHYTIWKRHFVS